MIHYVLILFIEIILIIMLNKVIYFVTNIIICIIFSYSTSYIVVFE